MTTPNSKAVREEFIRVLRLNGIKPTIDPEDEQFDDHLSKTLWDLISQAITTAKEETLQKVISEAWKCRTVIDDNSYVSHGDLRSICYEMLSPQGEHVNNTLSTGKDLTSSPQGEKRE